MAIQHHSTKLCEYLIRAVDGKFTLAGTFTNVYAPKFPHQQTMGIVVEIAGSENDNFKVSVEGPVVSEFIHLLIEGVLNIAVLQHEFEQQHAVVAGMSQFEFNHPGVYRVIVRSGEQIIHEYPFGVFSKEDDSNGG